MFNNADQKKTVTVNMLMADGSRLSGRLTMPATADVLRLLNGGSQFVEFVTLKGEASIVALGQVVSLEVVDTPAKPHLSTRDLDDDFDPYKVLGVSNDADPKAIHAAYVEKISRYHPDRFVSIQLPREVERYINAVARRLNAAQQMLQSASGNEAT